MFYQWEADSSPLWKRKDLQQIQTSHKFTSPWKIINTKGIVLTVFKENLLKVDIGVPKKGPRFSGPCQGYQRLKGLKDRGTVLNFLMDLNRLKIHLSPPLNWGGQVYTSPPHFVMFDNFFLTSSLPEILRVDIQLPICINLMLFIRPKKHSWASR